MSLLKSVQTEVAVAVELVIVVITDPKDLLGSVERKVPHTDIVRWSAGVVRTIEALNSRRR